eukprot:CAMPEP_0196638372 /NCGR_PEP_ID=MMETSP1085-20130531/1210_1 /TAXON_ID=41879 ORGANISM="Pycnococcus sp, Strain CCMP1998" /NCGR_SAMPLE_ID=MMETSP1085 /ASSEMBLY_ACC=CAM_ASM_000807 /LENGTH=362 /DNA_ID=CAMNT_0041967183 /DNA_START=100 /DNA_END=1186 /DNA_ORIENTATION=+
MDPLLLAPPHRIRAELDCQVAPSRAPPVVREVLELPLLPLGPGLHLLFVVPEPGSDEVDEPPLGELRERRRGLVDLHLPVRKEGEMGGPRLQAVKDVRRVDDGALPLFALLPEEVHQVSPAQHVQVHSDLVEEEDLELLQQADAELHAPPLALGHGVHPPGGVDVQHLDEALPPGLVDALDPLDHLEGGEVALERDVIPRKGDVPLPRPPDVRQPARAREVRRVEGRLPQDLALLPLHHVLARHDLHHGRLSRPVRADQQNPAALLNLPVQAGEQGRGTAEGEPVWPAVCEVQVVQVDDHVIVAAAPAAAASTSITPSPFAPLISASLSTSSCTRKRSTYAALWFVFPRPARAAPRCWKGPH